MLYMDSIGQNNPRLSEPFRVIRLKKVSFWQKSVFASSRWSENGLQGIVWDDFCTKPTPKIITKSLDSLKLSGKVEI